MPHTPRHILHLDLNHPRLDRRDADGQESILWAVQSVCLEEKQYLEPDAVEGWVDADGDNVWLWDGYDLFVVTYVGHKPTGDVSALDPETGKGIAMPARRAA